MLILSSEFLQSFKHINTFKKGDFIRLSKKLVFNFSQSKLFFVSKLLTLTVTSLMFGNTNLNILQFKLKRFILVILQKIISKIIVVIETKYLFLKMLFA